MNNIAHPVKRLLAYLIDSLVSLFIPLYLISLVSPITDIDTLLSKTSLYLVFLILIYPIIYSLLSTLLISRLGGTLGKLLTGTRIVTSKDQNLSFWMAFFRNKIGYMVSGFLMGLGFFWILIDRERRSWHDQIANTFVVVKNKGAVILGIIVLTTLIFVECTLLSRSVANFKSNGAVYQDIFKEIQTTFNPTDKSF